MRGTILVDIDVIVEYLKTGKGLLPVAFENYDMKIAIPVHTELLTSQTFKDEALEKEIQDFIDKYFKTIEISKDISIKAAQLLRVHDITMSQAYVAATALIEKLELLTNSKKEYERLEDLKILDLRP